MSRYAKAHEKTAGPGDARPTAMQIVQDEGLVGNMKDKVNRVSVYSLLCRITLTIHDRSSC